MSRRKLTKRQIREMKRRRYKCCVKNSITDTGHFSRGHHTHGPERGAIDHATGVGFVKDPSTTKAVLERMEALDG